MPDASKIVLPLQPAAVAAPRSEDAAAAVPQAPAPEANAVQIRPEAPAAAGEAAKPANAVPAQARAVEAPPPNNNQGVGGRAAPLSIGAGRPAASPEPAKPGLKPVGPAPVRLAAVRATGEAAPAASAGPGAAGRAAIPFALRPKGDTGLIPGAPAAAAPAASAPAPAPAAATPAADAEPKRAEIVSSGADAVRPKTDQRALYYQLMNGMYDALLILDDQGHVVDGNTRVTELLGYSREEAWDMPIEKIITGMSSQMFDHLRRNLAENHHILIDARCFRKDGSSFSSEVGVSTLSLTRGNNIVFAIRNVERRKNAMEELRRSHAGLEIALAPTFVCDPEGMFLVVNHAFLEAFGIPDEAQAKHVRFMDLLPDAARYFLRASCGEKIRERLQIATPNGARLSLDLSLIPVQTGQNVTAVAGSILQL